MVVGTVFISPLLSISEFVFPVFLVIIRAIATEDDTCRRSSQVFFDLQKCNPCVDTYAEGSIDPALWYKVLALESILIDCDRKVVKWTTEKFDTSKDTLQQCDMFDVHEGKVRTLFKGTELLFNESVNLSSSLTELFETAENVFHNLGTEMLQSVSNRCLQKDLLKILHVFILPEIKFSVNHTSVLQKALCTIEKEFENVEMLITMQVQMKRNCEDSLAKQRKYLLSNDGISRILAGTTIDYDVIKHLFKHTEKDTRKLEDTLIMLSHKINPLRNATNEDEVKALENFRAERDRVSKEKEQIVMSRGELKCGLNLRQDMFNGKAKRRGKRSTPSVRSEKATTDVFNLYRKETAELENLNTDIKQQIHIKIRMSAVREATSLTLKEIETDGSSYGYNGKKGSLMIEADLFDPKKKPEDWKTMNEQIQTLLQKDGSKLKTKYMQLCTKIKKSCRVLQEKTHGIGHIESANRETFAALFKKECEALCKIFVDDISVMADDIATEIQGSFEVTQKFHTQVYMCLAEKLSKDLMPFLSDILERCYKEDCEKLSVWIENYSATELESVNQIADNLFAIPFDDENYQQALDKQLRSAFETFFSEVQKAVDSSSILGKTSALTRAVQSTNETMSELRAKLGQPAEICTDDILDILIVLICRLGDQNLLKLYAHVNLVLNLSPYFLGGSMNEYVLITLTATYWHLFEHIKMHSNSAHG